MMKPEELLKSAASELASMIALANKSIKHDGENEPDYYDMQTCQELMELSERFKLMAAELKGCKTRIKELELRNACYRTEGRKMAKELLELNGIKL